MALFTAMAFFAFSLLLAHCHEKVVPRGGRCKVDPPTPRQIEPKTATYIAHTHLTRPPHNVSRIQTNSTPAPIANDSSAQNSRRTDALYQSRWIPRNTPPLAREHQALVDVRPTGRAWGGRVPARPHRTPARRMALWMMVGAGQKLHPGTDYCGLLFPHDSLPVLGP